ncbi:3-keto-5-aminohexanoate cleavage enzyme [Risungbinella massiliensis]|uniref:3-keto-5-aminohexanoate cleavage enzyme n=1 Tax=Risungbinella massiliensis TaxID=1329796 RepID=UPI0005CC6224|nr:3-keto-5-aminohexanoate cleavage protein [Risungbinella massiliensis]
MDKLIITAALVGAEVTRDQTPYLPITPEEIATQAYEVWQAGASIVHLHVRDEEGNASQDCDLYQQTMELIRERCDVIVQVSTGGAVGMSVEERMQPLTLSPEMATLTTGTVNFGRDVFWNDRATMERIAEEMNRYRVHPEFEIFDTGMISNAIFLVNKGYCKTHPHFDFVMGVPGGMPATAEQLLFCVSQIPAGATWTVAGIGRHQLIMGSLSIAMGGHVRVGLEDNIFYRAEKLATNRQLVERMVRISREMEREIATPVEARHILKLV